MYEFLSRVTVNNNKTNVVHFLFTLLISFHIHLYTTDIEKYCSFTINRVI